MRIANIPAPVESNSLESNLDSNNVDDIDHNDIVNQSMCILYTFYVKSSKLSNSWFIFVYCFIIYNDLFDRNEISSK